MGFRYGSLVEDIYTGYQLHCEGWKSIFCNPKRPAFLGHVPRGVQKSNRPINRINKMLLGYWVFNGIRKNKFWVIGLVSVYPIGLLGKPITQ